MLSDRDIIEKAKKAFISFIRSYKEHDVMKNTNQIQFNIHIYQPFVSLGIFFKFEFIISFIFL